MSSSRYIGRELEIFSHATCWKRYFGSIISPYLGKRVLEAGAGLGATSSILNNSRTTEWVCLEPDDNFAKILEQKINHHKLPDFCRVRLGTVEELGPDELFDTILYIDVMEHIKNDQAEIRSAACHLETGGRLIILSPAHQWLFTPFDQAIGHYRRYSKSSLSQIGPEQCALERMTYLDSAGMLLSLANKFLLRQSMPTIKQVLFWDRWIVPVSKVLDRVLGFRLGKSIIVVWRRDA